MLNNPNKLLPRPKQQQHTNDTDIGKINGTCDIALCAVLGWPHGGLQLADHCSVE